MRRDLFKSEHKNNPQIVSIHTPAWGVTSSFRESRKCKKEFQSTRLHEAWPMIKVLTRKGIIVSIHTPAWGVTLFSIIWMYRYISFNPHACMRRDSFGRFFYTHLVGFNPHACMRRDPLSQLPVLQIAVVSIHTPAWGVTPKYKFIGGLRNVSIHTPAWGVTWARHFTKSIRLVSIHTPAWGVTFSYQLVLPSVNLFQSTRLHEAWHRVVVPWHNFHT